jgi:hypothetical protein
MRILIMAATAALATACASPGPAYESRMDGGRYGYAEMQLEPNRIRVTYNGDTLTARDTVETYLLYRAAETTLQRGFDYFIVTAANVEEESHYRSTGGGRPLLTGATFREVSRHNAMADILMFEGERPPQIPNAYDASAVQRALQERIIQSPATN